MRIKIFLTCFIIVVSFACKDPYKPHVVSSSISNLVVEGVLNAGTGPTSIRLTRSFKLDDTARLRGERNAQVSVEGKDNTTRQLIMNGDGFYTSPGLNLVINNEYRLRIVTTDGKEYLSDYVVAKKTPLIDSIGWDRDDKGVQLYANAHDDANDTRYYRWDYDETWEIRSYYYALFKYGGNSNVVPRDNRFESVFTCWKYDKSTRIILGSTARLQSDIISKGPIVFFPNGDERLAVRYSILLRQYAIDKQGYEFYEMMKKNTENIGTIFDPQPSEINGNIHSVSDPKELVIGYVSASVVEEKRFFISRSELPGWKFLEDCPEILVLNNPDSILAAHEGGGSFYGAVGSGTRPSHYQVSTLQCVECPARGGSLIKPSYW